MQSSLAYLHSFPNIQITYQGDDRDNLLFFSTQPSSGPFRPHGLHRGLFLSDPFWAFWVFSLAILLWLLKTHYLSTSHNFGIQLSWATGSDRVKRCAVPSRAGTADASDVACGSFDTFCSRLWERLGHWECLGQKRRRSLWPCDRPRWRMMPCQLPKICLKRMW